MSTTGRKMKWQQVDLGQRQAWIWADQSKTRTAIAVPLNVNAVGVIQQQWGQHPIRVFTLNGQPIDSAGKAWRNAVKRAGLTDFRFHDLRHTWATRHIQAGTPLHALFVGASLPSNPRWSGHRSLRSRLRPLGVSRPASRPFNPRAGAAQLAPRWKWEDGKTLKWSASTHISVQRTCRPMQKTRPGFTTPTQTRHSGKSAWRKSLKIGWGERI